MVASITQIQSPVFAIDMTTILMHHTTACIVEKHLWVTWIEFICWWSDYNL
jgi:hypothetical protein